MASVFRRPGSRYWYAAFRIPLVDSMGKRQWQLVRQVTKETDRSKAQRAADLLEDTGLSEAGAGNEGSKQVFGILREAAEKAAQKRLTVALGKEYLIRIIELSTGELLRVWTTREWLTEWCEQKAATAKPATLARYKHSINSFLKHLGDTADLPLDHIRMQHVRIFRDKLHKEGRSSKTANGYSKDVIAALREAANQQHIKHLPAKLDALPEDDSMERKPFTLVEVATLIDAAPSADWVGVIILGAFGGLRLGDAARLKVKNVNVAEWVITYIPQKTSRRKNGTKEVLLPMHPEVVSYFRQQPLPHTMDSPCFPSLCRVATSGNRGLSTQFANIMVAAGVSRGDKKPVQEGRAGRTTFSRSFHSLRHTFNSWMLNKGVTQEMRMRLVGHSDKDTNTGYSHAEIESLRNAVNSVPGFTEQIKTRTAKKAGAKTKPAVQHRE